METLLPPPNTSFDIGDVAVGGELTGTLSNLHYGAGTVGNTDFDGTDPLARTKIAAPESWHVISSEFGSHWAPLSSLGSQWAVASYCLDTATETIRLKGAVYLNGTLATSVLFTMPTGYRPVKYRFVPICWYDASADLVRPTTLEVRDDGTMYVTPNANSGGPVAANDIFYLDGVSYRL